MRLEIHDRDGLDWSVARPDVANIVVAGDSSMDGALIGAGMGIAAAGIILGAVGSGDGSVLPSAKWGAPLLLSAAGGLLGLVIDRAHRDERLLYQAGRGIRTGARAVPGHCEPTARRVSSKMASTAIALTATLSRPNGTNIQLDRANVASAAEYATQSGKVYRVSVPQPLAPGAYRLAIMSRSLGRRSAARSHFASSRSSDRSAIPTLRLPKLLPLALARDSRHGPHRRQRKPRSGGLLVAPATGQESGPSGRRPEASGR